MVSSNDIFLGRGSFILSSEVAVEEVGEGIKRQILGYGSDIMSCRLWFESGSVGDIHSHFHSQTTYIESGRFLAHIDGEEREIGAGDCVYIKPNTQHGITCIEAGTLLDSFSPVREDFLGEGN